MSLNFTNPVEFRSAKEWTRAVDVSIAKTQSATIHPTRKSNGDDISYPAIPQALSKVDIFGKAVTTRKAEALWGRYVPVDGITNASNTSIDTGIKAQNNMEMFVRIKASTGSFHLLQARETGTSVFYGIGGGGLSGTRIFVFNRLSEISITNGHIYTIKGAYTNGAVTLYVKDETTGTEDTQTGTTSALVFPSPTTIKLFGDASLIDAGTTVYRAYIKVNGVMVWDMYPCVDIVDNNKVVAYDDVAHAASTIVSGSVTGGSLIQPISYLTFHGTECILPGFTGNVRWKIVAQGTKKTAQQVLLSSSQTAADATWLGEIGTTGKWGIGDNVASAFDVDTKATWDISFSNSGATGTINGFGIANTTAANHNTWALGATSVGNFGFTGNVFSAQAIRDGNSQDFIPVKVGTVGYLLDIENWALFGNEGTGSFGLGADIPYTHLCPDILVTNVGDVMHGPSGLYATGEQKVKMQLNGTVVEERVITTFLPSANSFIDMQKSSNNVECDWKIIWYDGTQTIPSGYISQTGDLTPNQIVAYPLATPEVTTVATQRLEITAKEVDLTLTSQFADGTSADLAVTYLGNPEPPPPPVNAVMFTAEQASSTITLNCATGTTYKYSTNGRVFNSYTSGTPITLSKVGDYVFFQGVHNEQQSYSSSAGRYSQFVMTGKIAASGNCNWLLDPAFANDGRMKGHCFYCLFKDCTSLTSAPELPSTEIVQANSCYESMFEGCSSLVSAPDLPATSLQYSYYCYQRMFMYCTSLTTAPELPATTLEASCYQNMFNGCTSLTEAPELPAIVLTAYCYAYMFKGCTNLATAPELPALSAAGNCYNSMFESCTSLVTPPTLPAFALDTESYYRMFYGCTSLATAPALPAQTLTMRCYYSMFEKCTSLTTASTISATTMAPSCCERMFYDCTSLVTAPTKLGAHTLATYCYCYMFYGCTSLTTGPSLSATNLVDYCCKSMFENCTSLNSLTIYSSTKTSSSTNDWLRNVASTGTLRCRSALSLTNNSGSGVPTGWTRVNI